MFEWLQRIRGRREDCDGGTPCTEVADGASDFIDESLASGERERISNHLNLCPGCSRFITSLQETVALLRATSRPPCPPGLKDRVKDRISGEPPVAT